MRNAAYVVGGLLLLFVVWHEIQAMSPCSAWANEPSQCTSDHFSYDK